MIACAVAGSVTRAAGGARAARAADRPRPDAVPSAPRPRRGLALLAGGRRARSAPPGRLLLAAVALLVALAIPATRLHVAQPSSDVITPQRPIIAGGADHHGFPRASPRDRRVRLAPPASAPRRAGGHGSSSLRPRAASHIRRSPSPAASTAAPATLELPLTGTGDDAASKHALAVLRERADPADARARPRRPGRGHRRRGARRRLHPADEARVCPT